MSEFMFRADGLTENDLRRWRRRSPASRVPGNIVGWSIAILAVIYPIWVSVQGRTPLVGECQGTISSSPMSGNEGDPATHTIVILRPFDERITRVTTNNPRCTACDATRTGPGRFVLSGPFLGSGPFRVEFIAFDRDSKERCRGYTAEIMALGPRRQ